MFGKHMQNFDLRSSILSSFLQRSLADKVNINDQFQQLLVYNLLNWILKLSSTLHYLLNRCLFLYAPGENDIKSKYISQPTLNSWHLEMCLQLPTISFERWTNLEYKFVLWRLYITWWKLVSLNRGKINGLTNIYLCLYSPEIKILRTLHCKNLQLSIPTGNND